MVVSYLCRIFKVSIAKVRLRPWLLYKHIQKSNVYTEFGKKYAQKIHTLLCFLVYILPFYCLLRQGLATLTRSCRGMQYILLLLPTIGQVRWAVVTSGRWSVVLAATACSRQLGMVRVVGWQQQVLAKVEILLKPGLFRTKMFIFLFFSGGLPKEDIFLTPSIFSIISFSQL